VNDQLKVDSEEMDNKPDKGIVQHLTPKISSIGALKKIVSSCFQVTPVSLELPTIDQDFDKLPILERVTESLRYNILCFEYSISPKGELRQWIKINISLLLLFGIPILFFIPLFTYFIGGFENIAASLSNITQYIYFSAFNILKAVLVIIVIASVLYIVFKILALRSKKPKIEPDCRYKPNKIQYKRDHYIY